MVRPLEDAELRRRADRLRFVFTDVDGVLTDGGVYYGASGEVLKRFSVRDGMGVERLRNAGIETGFITRETSPSVKARADKLCISQLHMGVSDKRAGFSRILDSLGVAPDAVAYIGDDVNDLELLLLVGEVGLTGAPVDAIPEVRRVVHHTTRAPGGAGAFRDFSEWLLSLKSTKERP